MGHPGDIQKVCDQIDLEWNGDIWTGSVLWGHLV